jgi:Sensors of blue-light using FAD
MSHTTPISTEDLFQLMYISSGVRSYSDQALEDILATARRKNARLDISGLLLYLDGNFLQVLEGREADVRRLYATIGKDTRHRGLVLLHADPAKDRSFRNWSMGFFRPERNPDNEALFNLTRESLRAHVPPDAPAQIRIFTETFYNANQGH